MLAKFTDSLSSYVGSEHIIDRLCGCNPLPILGRKIFLSLLSNLKIGKISVILTYNPPETFHFGDSSHTHSSVHNSLNAQVRIHSPQFWSRIIMGGDMGFSESYMNKEIDCDDMMVFLMIIAKNKPFLHFSSLPWAMVAETLDYLAHSRLANSIQKSLSNVSAHYDLSNEMFAAFLDSRMQYSCGIWDWSIGDKDTLESAQLRKINAILSKAKLTQNSRLLEIGSGWGGLAVEAVKQSRGCSVITITLSVEQKLLAEHRIRQAEINGEIPSGRILVLLCDYRNLIHRYPDGYFDTIISVEMIEAVGQEYLDSYFQICHRMLNPLDGVMVLQVITMPEPRALQYSKKTDFIQKYIFPGGFLPSISQLVSALHKGSSGNLIVQQMDNFACHYSRTLQAWRSNFVASYPTVKKAALSSTQTIGNYEVDSISDQMYANVNEIEGLKRRTEIGSDHFYRKFLYYFDYCAAGFATRVIDVYQVVLAREGCERLLEGPFKNCFSDAS